MKQEPLTRSLVRGRFRALVNFARLLNADQFSFGRWVNDWVKVGDSAVCGSVCCFVGWLPAFASEDGWFWSKRGNGVDVCFNGWAVEANPTPPLTAYFGFSFVLIEAAFLGANNEPLFSRNGSPSRGFFDWAEANKMPRVKYPAEEITLVEGLRRLEWILANLEDDRSRIWEFVELA
jgi:hypothetical protein